MVSFKGEKLGSLVSLRLFMMECQFFLSIKISFRVARKEIKKVPFYCFRGLNQ